MSYVIVFRVAPDVDHLAPLAWRLLEEGEEVHGIVSPGHEPAGDHRFDLLRSYPGFHLHEVCPAGAGRLRRISAYFQATVPGALWALRRRRARLLVVEWGFGLPPGYDRLASAAGVRAVARSVWGSFKRARSEPTLQLRGSFVVAARLLRIPAACLPHGLSVKLTPASEAEKRQVDAGEIDWTDRNRFEVYVLNTEHHLRSHLAAGGDPRVMQTWGSLRWDPTWFEVNREHAPAFEWPGDGGDRVRVVLMLPKWKNRVDAPAAIDLVKRLAELDVVDLAVLGHPRLLTHRSAEFRADPLRDDPDVDWSRIHDVSGINSVSVIRAADVVIDVGSSIGIEVLMQGKVLVNPEYIHEVRTLFDDVEGAAVVASSTDEVVGYLREHAAGRPWRISDDAYAELMRRAVYGGRPEPYDVGDLYYERLRAIAERGRG